MRCKDCDVLLTDFESTRLDEESGMYFDLCNDCFKPIAATAKARERNDLMKNKDLTDLDIPEHE